MKSPYYKIIIFSFLVLFLFIGLIFWWRSFSGNKGTSSSAGVATSSLDFPAVPRAEDALFSNPPSSEQPSDDAAFYAQFPPVADTYAGPVDSHGEPLLFAAGPAFNQLSLTRLSDQLAFFQWSIPSTGEVFYMTSNGKVFAAEEGDDPEISSQELPSPLRRALSSEDGRLVLGLFGTQENPRWGMYDTIDAVWRPLPGAVVDAAWGASAETILARRKEGDLLQLGTINAGDSALPFTPLIQDFRLKHVSMHALSRDEVLIAEDPAPGSPNRSWELNVKTLELRLLSAGDAGAMYHVSPSKNLVLKYASPDFFQILDSNFEEQAPVFFLTLPQKCGFEGANIFCFRPTEDLTETPLFFDDYLKQRILTTDILVSFGPNDLGEDTLFTSGGPDTPAIDAAHPSFAKGSYTFINRYDGYVYRLAR